MEEARDFLRAAMARFDAPLEKVPSGLRAHVDILPRSLRERLSERGIDGSLTLVEQEPVPSGTSLIGRAHPLTTTLAEALVESAVEPDAVDAATVGRLGAWPTPAVPTATIVALLRLRFKLTVHARRERLLVAEEASLVALRDGEIVSTGEPVRQMLEEPAVRDLASAARQKITVRAHAEVTAGLGDGPLGRHARDRAAALAEDHARLRAAAQQAPRVSVEPVVPPDLMALYVLLPAS